MDLMAVNSIETFGIDSRVECLFPCGGSSIVEQNSAKHSQHIFPVLFSLPGFKDDLDCWDSRSNWNGDVWGCSSG